MKFAQTFAPKHLISSLAVAALLGGTAAWAQEPATSPAPGDSQRTVMPGEAVPLPEVQTSGSASYVTGGIPYEQIPAFKQAARQYPLNVEIYERSGNKNQFTADADVKLTNKSGEVVLDARTNGPFLWAKVPPGQYTLQTTLNGKTKEQRVAVNGNGSTRAIVVFPQGTD
jgi:hypothetical protein